jgi:hypothetical protein
MPDSELQTPEFYSQEDVQQILNLAIARKTDQGELTKSQLGEIAAELDIHKASLQAAELEWLTQKKLDQKRLEFNRYRQEKLKQKTIRYLIINIFLITLNFISSHTLSWSIYVLLILGLPLVLNSWKTWQTTGEAYEEAFQRWNLKNEMKESFLSLWDIIKRAWQG